LYYNFNDPNQPAKPFSKYRLTDLQKANT